MCICVCLRFVALIVLFVFSFLDKSAFVCCVSRLKCVVCWVVPLDSSLDNLLVFYASIIVARNKTVFCETSFLFWFVFVLLIIFFLYFYFALNLVRLTSVLIFSLTNIRLFFYTVNLPSYVVLLIFNAYFPLPFLSNIGLTSNEM